jgi:hypothetical protein
MIWCYHPVKRSSSFLWRVSCFRMLNVGALWGGLVRLSAVSSVPPVRHLNANRAVVTKIKRAKYARLYPTTAVLPNGATITGLSSFLVQYLILQFILLFLSPF